MRHPRCVCLYLTEFEKQLKNRCSLHSPFGDDFAFQWNRGCQGLLVRVVSLEIDGRSRVQEARGQDQRQMTDIQLLDEQEVSRRLSVSVNTLRYWRACGDGPNYVKLGRLVRYDAVALEKFILRNMRVSKARATMEEKHVAL
jgi:hypothetical protein